MSRHVLCMLVSLVLVAAAGAQPLSKFRSVRVARVTTAAEELVALELDLTGTDLADSYETPGQYIQVRTAPDAKPGFFALANPPGQNSWELLVKTGTPQADQLAALAAGGSVEVTPAQGSGFPIAAHRGEDVVVLAMGSGISASRALVEYLLAHRADYGAITLIAGGRTAAHLAYRDRAAAWTAGGARVIWTISRPDPASPWSGPTGHVQDLLSREMLTARPTALCAVGSKEFMADLAARLGALDLSGVQPLTNF